MTADRLAVRFAVGSALFLLLVWGGQSRTSAPDPGGVRCVTVEERAACDLADARMDAQRAEEVRR